MLVHLAGTSKHVGWVDEAIGTSECVNDDQFLSDLTSVYLLFLCCQLVRQQQSAEQDNGHDQLSGDDDGVHRYFS